MGLDLQCERRHGQAVPEAYGDLPWAIFVRPDSKIREPKDLKDVPISVGMRAGSHFNVPYRLEKYLPLQNIKTVNTGGFGARLRALLDGEVEAASLLPPQIAMAEQLGLRKIIEDTFHTLWWVPDGFEPEATHAYLRALDRAEKAMDADLPKYLPLWKHAVPAEFETYHKWDFSKFGRGERFVYKTLPHSEFDEVMDQVKRWDLAQFLKDKSYDGLAAANPSLTILQAGLPEDRPVRVVGSARLCQHRGLPMPWELSCPSPIRSPSISGTPSQPSRSTGRPSATP